MFHIHNIVNIDSYVLRFTLVNNFLLTDKYYVYEMHKGILTNINIKIYESNKFDLKLKNYKFFTK